MKVRSVCAMLLGVSAVASSHAAPITDLRAFYIGDSITHGVRGEGDMDRDRDPAGGVSNHGTIGGFRLQIDHLFQTDTAFAIDATSETGLDYMFVGQRTGDTKGTTGIGEPDAATLARLRHFGIPGISANFNDDYPDLSWRSESYNFSYINEGGGTTTVKSRSLVDRFRSEFTASNGDGSVDGDIRSGFAEAIYGESLSNQAPPNLVSIAIGTNSISSAVGNLSFATNQFDDLMDTFHQLSTTTVDGYLAMDPSAHYVVTKILPVATGDTDAQRQDRIETTRLYNQAIETAATSLTWTSNVSVVDLFQVSASVVDDYVEANWMKWVGNGPGVGSDGTAISYNVASADDLRRLINPDQYDDLGNFNASLGDEWIDWVLEYDEASGDSYTSDLSQLVANNYLLPDRVHPSALGYDLVGEIYYQHLLEEGLVARLGDMNGDTVTDAEDVLSFVNALLTPGGDTNVIGADLDLVGDLNRDGLFNFDDIQPFAASIGVSEASIYALIPEPGTVTLLVLGAAGLLSRRRRVA